MTSLLNTSSSAFSTLSDPSHPMYPHTFTPLDLGPSIEPLPNRVIMGSMHCGLEGHSIPKPLSYLLKKMSPTTSSPSSSNSYSHVEALSAYFAERAANGVSLMVTGGISPNNSGTLTLFGSKLSRDGEVPSHKIVTDAVHAANLTSKILLQILHLGWYAAHPFLKAPCAVRSPLLGLNPPAMTLGEVQLTIDDYANCARLLYGSGYDDVELMGSEGYLIHQFLCSKMNQRSNAYGGNYTNRMRFALEIVRQIRSTIPADNFVIMFRLSMLDLVQNTSTWEEIVHLAMAKRIPDKE